MKKKVKKGKKKEENQSRKIILFLIILIAIILLFGVVWMIFIRGQSTGGDVGSTPPTRPPTRGGYDGPTDNPSDGGTNPPGGQKPVFPQSNDSGEEPHDDPPPGGGGPGTPNPITPPPNPEVNGLDTDGGLNYPVKGTCFDYILNYSVSDFCQDETTLIEFEFFEYDGLEGCWYSDHECPEVCVDGACTEQPGDPYIEDGIINCNNLCTDNGYENGNLPGEGPCDFTMIYESFDCCCNGELPSTPEQTCYAQCIDAGLDGNKGDVQTQAECESLNGTSYLETQYIGDCCCYLDFPEEINATDTDGQVGSYEGHNVYVKGTCTDSLGDHEEVCSDEGTAVLEYFINENQCDNLLIYCEYGCVDGACYPEPTSCLEYCESPDAGYLHGTCEYGRGTGEVVCIDAGGIYFQEGDEFCSGGRCCCTR